MITLKPYETLDTVAFGLRRQCVKCRYRVLIEVSLADMSLEDVGFHLAESVFDKQDKDGWKDGYCPDCAVQYANELHAIHNADADQTT